MVEKAKREIKTTFNDDDDTLCLRWWWSRPSLAAHWWRWTWERQMCSCSRQSPTDVENFYLLNEELSSQLGANLKNDWEQCRCRERQVWTELAFSIDNFFQSLYGDNADGWQFSKLSRSHQHGDDVQPKSSLDHIHSFQLSRCKHWYKTVAIKYKTDIDNQEL